MSLAVRALRPSREGWFLLTIEGKFGLCVALIILAEGAVFNANLQSMRTHFWFF